MNKFFIKSLGCKTNQLEGQIISENLVKAGFQEANDIKVAKYFILNSCTVTAAADSEVHYLLNRAKRENPSIITVLAGCIVNANEEKAKTLADIVLRNSEKLKIAEILVGKCQNRLKDDEFALSFIEKPRSSRVNIKIQEGCNNSCAYCIIPTARGKSRSNSVSNILSQVEHIANIGIDEVILTGIHIGQWGAEWGQKLLYLIKEIEKTQIKRYRLGSLYINELDDELIDFLSKSKIFCPHFHLSLQSVCNKTLKNMNRNYTVSEIFEVIQKIHKKFTLPFLGCDIIVGFPDETETDFSETLNNLVHAEMSKIHVFPYSRRKGTLADKMDSQIPENIKKERARKLIRVSNELKCKFLNKNIGREADVIFQNKIGENGLIKGVSENYAEVYLKPSEVSGSTIQKVKLTRENLKL